MLKVTMRSSTPSNGYTMTKGGDLKKGGKTMLRPARTRVYRGQLASAWFTKTSRAASILKSAGISFEENTPAAWGHAAR